MKRKIAQRQCQIRSIPVNGDPDLNVWLSAQAQTYGLTTLLAHADDGIIWGQVRDGKLHLSSEYFPRVSPPLRTVTLQEARLFGPSAEAHLWCDEDGCWQACLVQDGSGQHVEAFDEYQMLWGTKCEDEKGGFTLVSDGEMGHRHAPPVPGDNLRFDQNRQCRPLRLQVRHYLAADDDTGLMYVNLSRLVAVLTDTEVEQ